MQTLKFKTNIKCAGCIAAVTPYLNGLSKADNWKIDIENPEKILKIDTDKALRAEEVIIALENAGYKAEEI